jgi:hypothetical protein
MIKLKVNNKKFMRDMDNMVDYTFGFLDGVKRGFPSFLKSFGETSLTALKQYIDSNARVNPQLLHHVYEWSQTGSPDARLFNLNYTVKGNGLSFNSTFRQSKSIKDGSTVPFYNKAEIMENGIPVVIIPKQTVLAFEDNGEEVFTSAPVVVNNPGGMVEGEYQRVFDSFFSRYFRQSFLESTGIANYLRNPVDFKTNFSSAKRGGRSRGIAVGLNWIRKAGVA